ncbi:DUF1269 domain-containing protein [Microvirga yunnanensis]|uniref:DUF1269 domain-containing protein n=1 Tax=Microvirga yunnanensis TaxID=2953740 RepID=UPI0021C77840|nr:MULTISPECIES: DUF1269 domain-containing protein [unclassified Microvirga]
MDKMIMVVFDNETKAYDASRALADLHREGSLAVYSGAVIVKDASGKISVRQAGDQGPLGTALGMATGALIGALGGPVGLAAGAAVGAVGGSIVDLVNLGVGVDFLDEISRQLSPGKAAIVAEIEEEWVTPLDTRMEALGGTIYRRPRAEVIDVKMERDAALLQAELDKLQAEFDQASGEAKARLQAKVKDAKARLEVAKSNAKTQVDEMDREVQAKIQALHDQASRAAGDAKARLEKRIDEMKADYEVRSDKLRQAWRLTREALTTTSAPRR